MLLGSAETKEGFSDDRGHYEGTAQSRAYPTYLFHGGAFVEPGKASSAEGARKAQTEEVGVTETAIDLGREANLIAVHTAEVIGGYLLAHEAAHLVTNRAALLVEHEIVH